MDKLREETIECLALLEALIDFGEGEDIEEGVYDRGLSLSDRPSALVVKHFVVAVEKAHGLALTIESHLADARRGEIIRSGIQLSIFGPPNAGKSSLLNFLCRSLISPRLPYNISSTFPQLKGTQLLSLQSPGPRETSCPSRSISEVFRLSSQILRGFGRLRTWLRTLESSELTKRELSQQNWADYSY